MQKRYLRVMVSNKFEGIGGCWFPLYIPVYVEESNQPDFGAILGIDKKPTLLTEEEFGIAVKHDFTKKYGG